MIVPNVRVLLTRDRACCDNADKFFPDVTKRKGRTNYLCPSGSFLSLKPSQEPPLKPRPVAVIPVIPFPVFIEGGAGLSTAQTDGEHVTANYLEGQHPSNMMWRS